MNEPIPGSTPATPAVAAVAAPVAQPTQTQTPAVDPNAPSLATVPVEQLNKLLDNNRRLAELEAEQRQQQEAARTAQIKLLADKGEVERALNETRTDLQKRIDAEAAARAASEDRAKRYAVDSEVATALSQFPLVPGGADQLKVLFRGNLMAEARGDTFAVQTPGTLQPAKDFIASQLGRPEFAHFLRANNPAGGTGGATGAAMTTTTPAANPTQVQPKNFGEAIILQMQAIAKEQPSDARMNPAAPMGLNSRSIIRQA
jgi:hypothetical protein